MVGSVDSGVPNRALAGTCTISDHILDEEVWPNRSTFVAHLTKLADELLAAGVVNAAERAAIINAGANSSVGGDEEPAPVGGTVPATLSLTLGAPAHFGAFTPGVAREYTASTTANVISTAGDATLSVVDPSSNAPGRLVNGAFALPQPLQGLGDVKTYNGAGVQRRRDDHVQAGDRGDRRAAHGHVHQDADVHALDHDPVGGVQRPARFAGRASRQGL